MAADAGTARTIIHVDMDAFYAAVEQHDRPELRGKPVIVGGPSSARGVVSTASYEARQFGCRSAMPMVQAIRLCPQAIVVPVRMSRYLDISRQVAAIMERFTPLMEPLSIDEAFLDVTGSLRLFGSGAAMGNALREQIQQATGLTASVGVAPNKFIAKLAGDICKPDGLSVVTQDAIRGLLEPLPIERMWGVGRKTLPKLQQRGIATFGDLYRMDLAATQREFGESFGQHLHDLARGIDDRPVVPDREAKSISHETTFAVDSRDVEHLNATALMLTDHTAQRLRRAGRMARTVQIKLRTDDFDTRTRRITLESPTDSTDVIWKAAQQLMHEMLGATRLAIRLIGVGVSGLAGSEGVQLNLFDQPADDRRRGLDQAVDKIRERFGNAAVRRAGAADDQRVPDPRREG